MTNLIDLDTRRRRSLKKDEIEAYARRIGLSLSTINWLMRELREMSKPEYKG